jgi:limonene-1,2-epoxide hydrolase
MDAEAVVRAFADAWTALDHEAVYALLSEDVRYHNMPLTPVVGRQAVRAHLEAWPVDVCEWRILNLAVVGQVMLTERIDSFMRGQDSIVVPVMGAFEVRDGLIVHWRDYFDLGALTPRKA